MVRRVSARAERAAQGAAAQNSFFSRSTAGRPPYGEIAHSHHWVISRTACDWQGQGHLNVGARRWRSRQTSPCVLDIADAEHLHAGTALSGEFGQAAARVGRKPTRRPSVRIPASSNAGILPGSSGRHAVVSELSAPGRVTITTWVKQRRTSPWCDLIKVLTGGAHGRRSRAAELRSTLVTNQPVAPTPWMARLPVHYFMR